MPYIGHGVTNAGTFYILDDLTMSSSTTYTMQVGGVSVTPKADNLLITLDGVIQHTPDAYTVSGSTITFASAPGSGVDFYGIIMGQSASTGQGSIGADELKVTGDGTANQVLSSDADGTMTWKDGTLSTTSATGDIIYRNNSGVLAKLAIGSAGQLLTVAGGLPSWATDSEPYLPLAGGAMTGAITTNSTFDGVDIATRDGVLTSTTTTANAALPKAGGTMTGAVTGMTGLTGGTGDFNWDSNTLVVDSSESRVGIGTASPTSILNLHNSTASDGDGARATTLTFSGLKGSGSVKRTGSIKSSHDGAGNDGLGKLEFEPGEAGTKMTIDSLGNVGIGASPNGHHLLHITKPSGTLSATGYPSIFNIEGNTYTTSQNITRIRSINIDPMTIDGDDDVANAMSVYIGGSPTIDPSCGGTKTAHALYVASGNNYFGGKVDIGGTPTTAFLGVYTTNNNGGEWLMRGRNDDGTAGQNNGFYLRAGTNSSDSAFTIEGYDDANKLFKVRGDGNVCIGTSSTDGRLKISAVSGVDEQSIISLYGNNGNTYGGSNVVRSKISSQTDGTAFGANMCFYTNDTSNAYQERMRIDSSGQVGIRGAASSAYFHVHGSMDNTSSYGIKIEASDSDGSNIAYHAIWVDENGDGCGSITSNSSGNTAAYNESSDYRLKENEVAISDGITRLNQLKPYRFNWKKSPDYIVDGFFAHEVQEIVPQAVVGEKDAVDKDGEIERQMIDHSKLVPLLVAAVKELSTANDELSAKVTALENA